MEVGVTFFSGVTARWTRLPKEESSEIIGVFFAGQMPLL